MQIHLFEKVGIKSFFAMFQDVNLPGILESPISNMLRKVDKVSQDIPKHRKVITSAISLFFVA